MRGGIGADRNRIGSLLEWGKVRLGNGREAVLDAEVLLAAAAGTGREWIYANPEKSVPEKTLASYRNMVDERAGKRCPVAYLTERKEFFGMDFRTARGVFIPRPETEGLVELTAEILRSRPPLGKEEVIVDACCGSGVIGISLARALDARILATDISTRAIELTRENAARCGVESLVHAYAGRFLAPLKEALSSLRAAAIVANPPYVRSDELARLEPNVRDFEPPAALDGGPDGMAAIRALVGEAVSRAIPGCLLALEIGAEQEVAVRALLCPPAWKRTEVRRDLAGMPRYAVAIRATAG